MGTHDGDTSAANSAQRTIIIEPNEYGEFDDERAAEALLDLLGTLKTLGGIVEIRADRVKLGRLPGGGGKAPEPLGQTVGLLIGYRTIPVLTDEPLTVQLMDAATGRAQPERSEPSLEDGLEVLAASLGVSVDVVRERIAGGASTDDEGEEE